MNNIEKDLSTDTKNAVQKGFIKKLIDGDFGLAKTYWLFGVVGGIALNLLMMLVILTGSVVLIVTAMLLSFAFATAIFIAIWNSATKYSGSKFWSVLAKIIVVLNVVGLVLTVINAFSGA